jgi:putative transposase
MESSQIRLQAFKFELAPNGEQQRAMRRFAGSCRFVYNKALAVQKANRDAGGKFIGYVAMAKQLTAWRNSAETPWLADSPIHPLQQTLKDLETAYKKFFAKRAAFPKFKRRGSGDSFRYPDPKQFKIDQANSRIKLPKLGWIGYRSSRNVLGTPKNVTVSQSCGKWFVSIQTERDMAAPIHESTTAIGIDVGIARFATMSDAAFLAPLNSFKKHEHRLAKYQRRMSRKVKFSANWKKAKAKVTRVHRDIGNCRRDFLHKASTAVVRGHAVICVEDLRVKNMSASAAGSVEQPGRNVKQKSGLNKAILDQGWGEFRDQLEYKALWAGGRVVAVPPHHTSQTCPACGHVAKGNRQTQAKFLCLDCSYENHADVVGAINILSRGMKILRDEGQDMVDASTGCVSKSRTAQIACEVNGVVKPSAAGTHRSDPSRAQRP